MHSSSSAAREPESALFAQEHSLAPYELTRPGRRSLVNRSGLACLLATAAPRIAQAEAHPELEAALGDLFQLFFLGCVFLAFDLAFVLLSGVVLVRRRSAVALSLFGGGNILASVGFVDFAVGFHNAKPLFALGALQLAFALFMLSQARKLWLVLKTTSSKEAAPAPPNPPDSPLTGESQ